MLSCCRKTFVSILKGQSTRFVLDHKNLENLRYGGKLTCIRGIHLVPHSNWSVAPWSVGVKDEVGRYGGKSLSNDLMKSDSAQS